MDDRKLRVLLTTLHLGSFSRAAQELNCTQSAVTQMMNALENEFGCKVLVRNHSGVKLTAAGKELFPFMVEAEASLSRLMDQARNVAEGKAIPIRIGTFSSISNTWLPHVLQAYQKKHPDITFDIRVGTDAITDWLIRGEIDLALGDADRCRVFRWHPLMDDPYYAVMPQTFAKENQQAITQEEFAAYPFIMAPMNALKKHLAVLPKRQIEVNCDDDSTLISMVVQGLGVTAMPKLSLKNIPKNVKVLKLIPPTKRVLGIALPNSPSKTAVDFSNFLHQCYPYKT
ncbi:MAG: LysR family transcriptional regulator [Oscillospiraceae bacterium]|jgi:DNA-binding transcriptional LysR family regulator|nr:LysR family transcriptional regulator [Oscillospiraceae bacterium]